MSDDSELSSLAPSLPHYPASGEPVRKPGCSLLWHQQEIQAAEAPAPTSDPQFPWGTGSGTTLHIAKSTDAQVSCIKWCSIRIKPTHILPSTLNQLNPLCSINTMWIVTVLHCLGNRDKKIGLYMFNTHSLYLFIWMAELYRERERQRDLPSAALLLKWPQ